MNIEVVLRSRTNRLHTTTTEFTSMAEALMFINNMSPVFVEAIRFTGEQENEPSKVFRTSEANSSGSDSESSSEGS